MKALLHPIHSDATDQNLIGLLHAVQKGCTASFERLYRLTSPKLFGIVLRIHSDRAEAEDVLQEVFLRVWCRCGQYEDDKGSVMQWLSGIARFSAIDGHRYRIRHPETIHRPIVDEDDLDPYAYIESSDLQTLDRVIFDRRAEAVRAGLLSLSNTQRQSVALAHFDGLSHAQIAVRLGQPLGTVKTWLRRAYDELRPALAAHR